MQATRERRRLRRLALRGHPTQGAHAVVLALGHEHVSVRRHPQQPRVVQALGVKLHLEPRRRLRQRALGPRHQVRAIVDRLRLIRRR